MKRSLTGLPLYTLAYCLLLELMLVPAILYWPSFAENLGAIRVLSGPIPALQDVLSQIEETGIYGYVTGQHFFKGCNTLGTAAAVLFAVGAVAGEVHRGTLEIWLARPVTRRRLLTERYVAGAAALVVPIFLTTLTIPPLVERVEESVALAPLLLGAVHEASFLLVIYSLTFFFSSIGSNPTRIALLVLFVSTFEFAIYMVKVVTHWSVFRLADIETFVKIHAEGLNWVAVVSLLVASGGLYFASLAAFHRRVP